MNDICKFCSEPLPKLALHFSNRIAIELGYCCFMFMRLDLGDEKAFKRLASSDVAGMRQRGSIACQGPGMLRINVPGRRVAEQILCQLTVRLNYLK